MLTKEYKQLMDMDYTPYNRQEISITLKRCDLKRLANAAFQYRQYLRQRPFLDEATSYTCTRLLELQKILERRINDR